MTGSCVSQPNVWKELLLAAIGEQLSGAFTAGDELGGLSVSVRDRDDVIQLWNTRADLADDKQVSAKIKQLLPNVTFSAFFYKG